MQSSVLGKLAAIGFEAGLRSSVLGKLAAIGFEAGLRSSVRGQVSGHRFRGWVAVVGSGTSLLWSVPGIGLQRSVLGKFVVEGHIISWVADRWVAENLAAQAPCFSAGDVVLRPVAETLGSRPSLELEPKGEERLCTRLPLTA